MRFSPSSIRCSVVQADPRPRLRAASMKLHTAGSSEPHEDAAPTTGRLSRRPSMQGMRNSGERSKFSAR
ncbi:Uncharacterised protein [Mycobacteroides abscessus subsp. abscessus]|nr:Uncharacterised protein [Mycobacteroides abscessus subsp. abscessus]